ncbi:hypothetical protein [Hymenobacter negativus]|uniref:DUF4134 domain-containing protein n=1 Tax=Hymenobacter negativus TaxID=2795026 RepID=A0ABS3Q9K4_9BACT|nr:hypothetical protein [Hymenobacter negativus]MBO2007891.1 hypothetical protein [Hymenobacter negativus]
MTPTLRVLALCLSTSALLWAPACSSSSDPTPQNQATTGSVTGIFSPLLALASVTATLALGTYSFAAR